MNPFSRFLSQWSKDSDLKAFVENWDRFEQLCVRIYRRKLTPEAAAGEHAQLRAWLIKEYVRWAPTLRPYWQASRVGGELLLEDPFAALLQIGEPVHIRESWPAMRLLPAAREAINLCLLDAHRDD
jgi:hypothetical protein